MDFEYAATFWVSGSNAKNADNLFRLIPGGKSLDSVLSLAGGLVSFQYTVDLNKSKIEFSGDTATVKAKTKISVAGIVIPLNKDIQTIKMKNVNGTWYIHTGVS